MSGEAKVSSQTILIELDQLGQTYHLDSLGQLIKSKDGEISGRYLRKQYGPPQQVDVFNPQKVLLFYKQFNKLLILDQTLTSEREVDIETTFGWQLSAVGQSSDRQLWTYDPVDRKVRKADYNGTILQESDPITFYIEGRFDPQKLIERDGLVILSDPSKGWLRLDLFGQFVDFIPQDHQWFTVLSNGELLYWVENRLYKWKPGVTLPAMYLDNITQKKGLLKFLPIKE